jgi:hypothetical protein
MSGANGDKPLRKRLASGEKVSVTKLANGGMCGMNMTPTIPSGKKKVFAPNPITAAKRNNGVPGFKKGGKAKGGSK